MIREILFCGKRIDNGEWIEGYYVHTRRHHCIITGCIDDGYVVHGHYANDVAMEVVDPATVGQYTGLTANGKKIFEGHVGRYRQTDGAKRNGAPILCVGMVVYNAETASYAVDSRDDAGCRYFDYFPIKDFEVIGNIHDNPELLEGGAEE